MVESKEFQGGSGGDHHKKDPRKRLGPGSFVRSQLQKGVVSKVDPRPTGGHRASGKTQSFKAASWNVGTLTGKGIEVMEEMSKKKVVVGCLQETRWKGMQPNNCKRIGDYKLFWSGNRDGNNGVAIAVISDHIDKVLHVDRINDRLISIDMVMDKVQWKFISAYAPQVGCSVEEKEEFYDRFNELLAKVKETDHIFVGGDFNGHVGEQTAGFDGIHGGYGIGQRNAEGMRLLEACAAHGLVIANTCFMKKKEQRYTYRSGNNKSQIDFALISVTDRKYVKDCRVYECDEYQHCLLVARFEGIGQSNWSRKTFIPKRRTWLLKNAECSKKFESIVREKWNGLGDSVDGTWKNYTECVLEAADKTCGWTKAPARRKITWWWNEELRKVLDCKKKKFREMKEQGTDESKALYKLAKNEAKKCVSKAMEEETRKVVEEIQDDDRVGNGKRKLFRMARQHARDKKDIVGGQCVKDKEGKLCIDIEDKKRAWRTYMEKLLNEENEWNGNVEDSQVEGEIDDIDDVEIITAMKQMKEGKACGISNVSAELLMHSGEIGVAVMKDICNKILNEESIPEDWKNSVLVPLYKGKGDPKECGSYRGIKLLEHGMKIMERVLERRLREKLNIDEMQFGFMPGRGTTDAIFIVRQLQEKYLQSRKNLYFCFVDLEKAFDRVPRRVIEFALRRKGIEEKLVQAVMRLFEGAKTRVRVESELSDAFEVKVGVHQGSVLSPLLFITVMDILSEDCKDGLLYELLYADDLVLTAHSMQELQKKFESWRVALESRGLRINVGKTKIMVSDGLKKAYKSTIDPCSICGKRVGRNSIRCNTCRLWVHQKCSRVKGCLLKSEESFVCEACQKPKENRPPHDDERINAIEMVQSFCYLGDVLQSDGGCDIAVSERVRKGWWKFRELSGVLCNRRLPLTMRGVLYRSCVRTVLVYGCETWAIKKENEDALVRTERRMMRMMCGVTLRDRVESDTLKQKIGLIDDIITVMRKARLRWFGHVKRRDEGHCIKRAFSHVIDKPKGRGRPRKTWYETIRGDLKFINGKEDDTMDRVKWRLAVRNVTANPNKREKRQYNNV